MPKQTKKRKHTLRGYRRKKSRALSIDEKQQIRRHFELGQTDVYELAGKFGCVASQIAGLKARLKF